MVGSVQFSPRFSSNLWRGAACAHFPVLYSQFLCTPIDPKHQIRNKYSTEDIISTFTKYHFIFICLLFLSVKPQTIFCAFGDTCHFSHHSIFWLIANKTQMLRPIDKTNKQCPNFPWHYIIWTWINLLCPWNSFNVNMLPDI